MTEQPTTPPSFPFAHMAYGGDYNPEQWPEETWQEDVRLMQEAGVNLVSLGIFSWAKLEPTPGNYDFGWFDRIMDLLHAHGVRVDLASATASPPPWLARLYPESLPVTADGVTLWPGGRQHYCPSSPAYRQAAQALVRQLATRYRDHPALAMWHIGNEYACHVAECFCDESARDFRAWLKRRYATLDALNEAWGTAFWSQQYSDWEEINPPRRAPTYANPTQQLDWRRFSSDALLECFDMERAIIKELTPDVPVTTNFMVNFKPLDYWKWAEHQDVITLDQYQDPAEAHPELNAALNCDMMRSLGHGRPWLLMEQATSNVNWRPHNLIKQPGQMRLWSHQAIARGSAGLMYFQWRAGRAGAEKYHSGMVPHGGSDTRVWREVVALGQELKKLDPLLSASLPAEVAIVLDWDSWWALELDSKPSKDVQLISQIHSYYNVLFQRNIAVDFVQPDADLSAYRLVLAPNLYLVRQQAAQNLEQYVAQGGTLVMSFFSGMVNEHEHIWLGGYPAPFRKLLGLRVEEYVPFAPEQSIALATESDGQFTGDLWADAIDLEGAEALASYTGTFLAGRAAITRHAFGQGAAYYLGTRPTAEGMAWVLGRACEDAGVKPAAVVPARIEAVRRSGPAGDMLYLLNHSGEPAWVTLDTPATDLITGKRCSGALLLEVNDVAILLAE
ncbi:beta-galactosidase [Chloroflexia bacterium SDU3-3]|nr:beta-galactosidase [Chloroflexia bacterium SDU3-3]